MVAAVVLVSAEVAAAGAAPWSSLPPNTVMYSIVPSNSGLVERERDLEVE